MLPVYYFSVTTNLIMGLILACLNKEDEKYPILRDPTFLLMLFVLSGIAAVLKLVSPVSGAMIIISDMLPALSGGLGSIVFFKRWMEISKPEKTFPAFFERIISYEHIIGFCCLGAGILHLLFSEVLFL